MMNFEILWKKLWGNWWKSCGFGVEKTVGKSNLSRFYKVLLWNMYKSCEFLLENCGFRCYCGGKDFKSGQLIKSRVSTVST